MGRLSKVVSCVGKTKWRTERSAQQAVTSIKRDGGDMDSTVRPYRCNFCRRWHVGHEM